MNDFTDELEVFRKEQNTAQQMFFAWLAMRATTAEDREVLRCVNNTPLFWINVQHALLVTAFVNLHRIFDQESKHNIDRLIGIAENNLSLFTRDALRDRKIGERITKEQAASYVANKHELTAAELRIVRKQIEVRRRLYEDRYRDIRNKVFAHKATDDAEEIDAMFAKTNIEEMKGIFGFLHALYDALWEQYFNGRRMNVVPYKFNVPPDLAKRDHSLSPGEIIYRQAHTALLALKPQQADVRAPELNEQSRFRQRK